MKLYFPLQIISSLHYVYLLALANGQIKYNLKVAWETDMWRLLLLRLNTMATANHVNTHILCISSSTVCFTFYRKLL